MGSVCIYTLICVYTDGADSTLHVYIGVVYSSAILMNSVAVCRGRTMQSELSAIGEILKELRASSGSKDEQIARLSAELVRDDVIGCHS